MLAFLALKRQLSRIVVLSVSENNKKLSLKREKCVITCLFYVLVAEWQEHISNAVISMKTELRNNGRVLRRIYDMLSNGQHDATNEALVHNSGLRGQLPCATMDALRTLDYDIGQDDELFRELVRVSTTFSLFSVIPDI